MFTLIVISTLQNDRLNRGLLCDYICFSYLRTFAAVFLIMYVCAYLIYREKPKTLLFDVCSRFPSYMYVCTIFLFWYVCIRLFPFLFSLAFCFTKIVRETLCKFPHIYAKLKCIFMQRIMINRKLFGKFAFFSTFAQTFYLFTLYFFAFPIFWINYRKRKQKQKNVILGIFAVIRPFLSQIKRWFSVVYRYVGQNTHHPPFLALAGWVSSCPKFFYFFIFYFCKILRFCQFCFSTEF